MSSLHIAWSAKSKKDFRRLDANNKKRVLKALAQFTANPHHPGLNFESITNSGNNYTIRVSLKLRIFMERLEDEQGECYELQHIGSHDLYKSR